MEGHEGDKGGDKISLGHGGDVVGTSQASEGGREDRMWRGHGAGTPMAIVRGQDCPGA